jgi:AraC-like DNA-binding protein
MHKALHIEKINREIDVSHRTDTYYENFFMHLHNHYEIYFSNCSGNKVFVGDKIFNVNKNDVFIFDNTDLHKVSVLTNEVYDRYIISFLPEMIRKFGDIYLKCFNKFQTDHSYKISLSEDEAVKFRAMLDELIEITYSDTFAKSEKQKLLLCRILLFVNEAKYSNKEEKSIINEGGNEKINSIIDYINRNYSGQLSLDMLSKLFYMDKFYLCRLFKKHTGFSLNEYITACRISHAVGFLQNGDSVSETALKCGFGSDTYFISTFKKSLGISPKKYSLNFKKQSL